MDFGENIGMKISRYNYSKRETIYIVILVFIQPLVSTSYEKGKLKLKDELTQ